MQILQLQIMIVFELQSAYVHLLKYFDFVSKRYD